MSRIFFGRGSLLLAVTLSACGGPAPSVKNDLPYNECIIAASYERQTELSSKVWSYLRAHQYDLLDLGDRDFAAAVWYSPGEGRVAMEYRLDCEAAIARAQTFLRILAEASTDAQIARSLQDANATWRVIDRAEYENVVEQ